MGSDFKFFKGQMVARKGRPEDYGVVVIPGFALCDGVCVGLATVRWKSGTFRGRDTMLSDVYLVPFADVVTRRLMKDV